MAVITPPALTPLPIPPSTAIPADFDTKADAFLGALPVYQTEENALANNVFLNATDAAGSATSAATSASNAVASELSANLSATASAAYAGAAVWVSGTFTAGQVRYSPTNQRIYRKVGSAGGTLDPANDGVNWALVSTNPIWITKLSNYTSVSNESILANTTAGTFTITLPSTPLDNEIVNIKDYAGTFGTNKLVVGRNGKTIMGLAEDMDITTSNLNLTLTFISATNDWRF